MASKEIIGRIRNNISPDKITWLPGIVIGVGAALCATGLILENSTFMTVGLGFMAESAIPAGVVEYARRHPEIAKQKPREIYREESPAKP
jgi:hypothetical protein